MVVPDVLRAAVPYLRCPVCDIATDAGIALDETRARCTNGHSFDLARQGYLAMLTGRGAGTGDTSAMVAARAEVFAAGWLAPVVSAVGTAAAEAVESGPSGPSGPSGLVLDLAGGTGHYLVAVLDRAPQALGVCLDASAPALRRAARSHPRAAAVAADVWTRLPVASGSTSVALSVFGPRNAAEVRRVLAPGGRVIVAAPEPDHLAELVGPLGLVRVDARKTERQAATFADFTVAGTSEVRSELRLDHAAIAALVTMGPSAGHLAPGELTDRLRHLPESVEATVAVRVTTYAG